jgi:hypothetical protein
MSKIVGEAKARETLMIKGKAISCSWKKNQKKKQTQI